jgi:hypothetical protein
MVKSIEVIFINASRLPGSSEAAAASATRVTHGDSTVILSCWKDIDGCGCDCDCDCGG